MDADKPNYINYFHQIIDKLNPGGVILSDNVLWSGKVIETLDPSRCFNQNCFRIQCKLLKEDPRYRNRIASN